ncbi:uncharacterized protein LOC128634517 [Ictalurus punctatus]|uniref:Uncharacterized protein LOC128634517 n=1 Tax=Ictalurus punctatus TaxID=7998 RepID=A0A9F7RDP8_ICTPU|nr:uncharacterized protein LOC128634517 [Ictalurus punctatus]
MWKQQVATSAAEEARIWALLRSSLEMSKQLEEEMAQCKAELRAASSLAPYTPSPPPRSDALQHSQQSNLSIWGFPLQGRYTLLRSPEVKAGPEIFLGGGAMRTAELQPEAYGEVSAVELSPEVNMATSEGQAEEAAPHGRGGLPAAPHGRGGRHALQCRRRWSPEFQSCRGWCPASQERCPASQRRQGRCSDFLPRWGCCSTPLLPDGGCFAFCRSERQFVQGSGTPVGGGFLVLREEHPLEGGSVTPRPAEGTAVRLLIGHVTLLFSFTSRLDTELGLSMSLIWHRCPWFELIRFVSYPPPP